MDNTVWDYDQILENYDQSLEDLERQREHLKTVMEKMGQEWEESGAGIGWLGSLDIPTAAPIETCSTSMDETNNSTPISTLESSSSSSATVAPITSAITTDTIATVVDELSPISPTTNPKTLSALTEQPLLSNILRPSTGPSPDYLQSLLNVNEALLAQSLANSSSACSTTVIGESPDMESHHDTPTPTLSPIEDHHNTLGVLPTIQSLRSSDLDLTMASPPITPDESAREAPFLGNSDPDSEVIDTSPHPLKPYVRHPHPSHHQDLAPPSVAPTSLNLRR